MLRNAWFIARKDLRYMLRQRETLLWVFAMPFVFFYFIGTVTGGFGGGGGGRAAEIVVRAPASAGFLAGELVRRLEERDYRVVRAASEAELAAARRRLIIPENLTDSVLAGRQVTLHLVTEDEGRGRQYDVIRVNRAAATVLADLAACAELGEAPGPEAFARLAALPRALTLKVTPAGRRLRIPRGFEQTIPGTMVMFTLLVMLTSGAVLLVIERREGLLRRLASTPIARGEVVLGKWGGRMVLGLTQIGFAMVMGSLVFKMDWGPDLAMVLLVMIAYAALMASLGLLFGSVARTHGQAVGLGVLGSNLLAALGGCWWPIEITPRWMQGLALFLPTGWAMDALHKLVSFGAGPASAAPHVAGMALAAVVLGALAARAFRFQ